MTGFRFTAFSLTLLLLLGCGASKQKRLGESEARFRVAQDLFSKGETTRALSELLKAEKMNPKNPEIKNLLALAYMQRGLLNKAEEKAEQAVKLDPTYSEARNHLSAIYLQQDKFDRAIFESQKAIENVTYPTPERAYHNMGLAYERKGETRKAITAYRQGLNHNKNFVLSRRSLAVLYLKENSSKKALRELNGARDACKASTKGAWGDVCPEVLYRLGMTYVRSKKRQNAMKIFQECVDVALEEGEYGEKCRARLALLTPGKR